MVVHAVAAGQAPGHLVPLLYEVADDRDLPDAVRGEETGTGWRLRARHRLHEPQRPVDRAADADIVALLSACRSARDRLIVLLMTRAGLRRGEVLGCAAATCTCWLTPACWDARWEGAPARGPPGGQSQRGDRQVPPPAGGPAGLRHGRRRSTPMSSSGCGCRPRPARLRDGEPVPGAGGGADAAGRGQRPGGRCGGAGGAGPPSGSASDAACLRLNVLDAGGSIDEAQELLGHASVSSTEVYTIPTPRGCGPRSMRSPAPANWPGGPGERRERRPGHRGRPRGRVPGGGAGCRLRCRGAAGGEAGGLAGPGVPGGGRGGTR